jgi:phosphate transport system protein
MREVFHQSLEDLQNRLVEIADLVTVSIDKATRAFATSDVALAEEVIADDAKIDELAVALDEQAIEILARQQPVARDLRIVVTALRVSASLERMGDMSEHISQLARLRFPERAVPKGLKGTFTKMGELDVEIARTLSELLRTQDLRLADAIRNTDDDIDELHASVFEKVLSDNWKGEATATVDATLASRYHERFADHAVAVAKKVVYLATGDWHVDEEDIALAVEQQELGHACADVTKAGCPRASGLRHMVLTSCPGPRRRQHRRQRPPGRGSGRGRWGRCSRRARTPAGCRWGC